VGYLRIPRLVGTFLLIYWLFNDAVSCPDIFIDLRMTLSVVVICLLIYGSPNDGVRPDLGIYGFMHYLATIWIIVYKYYVSGHHPSSCLCFITRRFGDWVLFLSPETGTSSIGWSQLSRFYLKTEAVSSLRNVVFWNINRAMYNAQKHNICTNVPSLQILYLVSSSRLFTDLWIA
jgi:hypothetical protein